MKIMKSIYTATLTLAIVSIFSLGAWAQGASNGTQNGYGNGVPNGVSNGTPNGTGNGVSNGTSNGLPNGSSNGISNGAGNQKPKVIQGTRVRQASPGSSMDQDQVTYNVGVAAPANREFDRYGYQGLPLSSRSRPCLVSGARRCVE